MIGHRPAEIAEWAGARLVGSPPPDAWGPRRAVVDSRAVGPGDLFVGILGERHDGGAFGAQALAAGAWGVLVAPDHAEALAREAGGAVLAAEDPLAALQSLASAWRARLACPVIGVTGSTGKTSTKDILAALLAPHRRTVASPQNLNTEIGLPLAILAAPAGTEVLVLELAMRGRGQIAELVAICRPDVGIVVNVGPVHLELLGSITAVAEAKAELLRDMEPGTTAIVPAGEPLLTPHLRDDQTTVTFGEGGDVRLVEADGERLAIDARGERIELEVPFSAAHLRTNLLAAVGACQAIGVVPSGPVEVEFSALRHERIDLPGGIGVINDCYNANPMSMRAALDDLALSARGRRLAVLGDMLELGPQELRFHAEIGEHARERGVDVLLAVGERSVAMAQAFGGEAHVVADAGAAAQLLPTLVRPGDTVLVKGSRGIGLEAVAPALADALGAQG